MREAVAKAIYEALPGMGWHLMDGTHVSWDGLTPEKQEEWMKGADAAIAAMSRPLDVLMARVLVELAFKRGKETHDMLREAAEALDRALPKDPS